MMLSVACSTKLNTIINYCSLLCHRHNSLVISKNKEQFLCFNNSSIVSKGYHLDKFPVAIFILCNITQIAFYVKR